MKQKNIVFLQQLAEMFDCFIATAVFGPQASEVEIFRRFRNQTLKNSVWGRAFINWYYDNGPVIAFYLYQHRELQPPIRTALGALAWILESSQQRFGAHYAR